MVFSYGQLYYELGLEIGQVRRHTVSATTKINFYVPGGDRVACLYYQPHQEMGFLATVSNMAHL